MVRIDEPGSDIEDASPVRGKDAEAAAKNFMAEDYELRTATLIVTDYQETTEWTFECSVEMVPSYTVEELSKKSYYRRGRRGRGMTEKYYDDEIAPKLAEITQLCQDNGMSFFAAVEYEQPGEIAVDPVVCAGISR